MSPGARASPRSSEVLAAARELTRAGQVLLDLRELALGKAAAKGRGGELDKLASYARHGHTGAREPGKIGFSVARGGDVVGDHTVYYYSEGERVELKHIATDRALFARGALRAALWTQDKKDGLYSMRDVLGL